MAYVCIIYYILGIEKYIIFGTSQWFKNVTVWHVES